MSARRRRRAGSHLATAVGLALFAAPWPATSAGEFAAPNPWIVLRGVVPPGPPIDASAACFPSEAEQRHPDWVGADRGTQLVHLETLENQLERGEGDAWAGLLRAQLRARTAVGPEESADALAELAAHTHTFPPGRTRACLGMEVARLELIRGNYPEAAGWSRVVEEDLDAEANADTAALRERAAFLHAEALYLSGRRPQARAIYERLADSTQSTLSRAARLRSADLTLDRGRPEGARARYEALLPEAAAFGAEAHAWAARVGEAAFQSADYGAALAWFQQAAAHARDARERALAEIRVADSAALMGKLPESRALLLDIAEFAADPLVRQLAGVRLSVPPVGARNAPEEIERLLDGAESSNPRLSIYARAELGRAQLENGEVREALETLTRVAFEQPDPALAPWWVVNLADALDAVIARAESEDGCREVIDAIGWRRGLLLQRSDRPAPFLRLGLCYEEAGLYGQAIDLYRAMVKRFGLRLGDEVSLPLARTALRVGEIGVAKTAAETRIEEGHRGAWQHLLAQVQWVDGREDEALATWRTLLEEGDADLSILGEATWHYAIVGLQSAELASLYAVLATSDPILEAPGVLSPAMRADVLWVRAEASRQSRLFAAARRDYEAAAALLEQGPRHAAAQYWMGVLADDPELERAFYDGGKKTRDGGLWGELSSEELALSRLRERYGRPRELVQ